jgi:hypothetical protein
MRSMRRDAPKTVMVSMNPSRQSTRSSMDVVTAAATGTPSCVAKFDPRTKDNE